MYRGWRSTKLHLALITMALVCAGYVAIGMPSETFGEACMALIASAGIYSTGSVVETLTRKPSKAKVDDPDAD